MNFTQFDEAFGLSSMLSALNDTVTAAGMPEGLPGGMPSVSGVFALGGAAVLGLALWEQLRFKLARRSKDAEPLPGPGFAVPFVGGIVEMVKDPHAFWEKQRRYSFPGLSWNSILSKFTVMVTDPGLVRHVFNHNSADTLLLELHPSAKMILGKRNIAFMHGPEHKALRKSFLALFTRKALSSYVVQQDGIIRDHIAGWMEVAADKGPLELRPFIRDMNACTSQDVFVGPYLGERRQKFSDSYAAMTDAFLAFPLKFPGTAVWRGMKGRHFILQVLKDAAAMSKLKMRKGLEPECLLDYYAQQVVREIDEAAAAGVPPPSYSSDIEIAYIVMDFLFASQDASTASLVWTVTLMAEHPDVLHKVREEQLRARPDLSATITGATLNEMPYTRQVVKEILRYRPPAPMVPQIAKRPFKISETFTAPKGSFIIPCIISACKSGYENAEAFDPDRFSPERQEDIKFAPNYMVFGHGPHYCVGKEYAINHLMTFLAITSTSLDVQRLRTDKSDSIKYLPTIYPHDSVFKMAWRQGAAPPVAAAAKAL